MRPIQREFWLSLRDAAKLVGKAACGDNWSDELLDLQEDQRHLIMRKDLFKVLESDEVPTLFDDGAGPIESKPTLIHDLTFTIDVANNAIFLGQFPGHQFSALIHRQKLEDFLKQNYAFRSSANEKDEQQASCKRWLLKEMRKSEHRANGWVKRDYLREAQQNFPGLSLRAFDRAWKESIKETGAIGWRKGGRPKRSHKTETPAAP